MYVLDISDHTTRVLANLQSYHTGMTTVLTKKKTIPCYFFDHVWRSFTLSDEDTWPSNDCYKTVFRAQLDLQYRRSVVIKTETELHACSLHTQYFVIR